MEKIRICIRCKLELPVSAFTKAKNGNKGYTSRCSKCIYDSYYKNKNDKDKYIKKLYQIKYYYNLSKEEYEKLVNNCNNSCLICRKSSTELKTGLCVDHSHKTNKIRGLLCQDCNRGLGMFKENIQFLKNAINYLENTEVND